MPARRVLILGGTSEARALAARLVASGHDVTTSFAGVTQDQELPRGAVRRGGFGGAGGLAAYIREEGFDALIDATHPFAARISTHAVEAARSADVELLRLERPAWCPEVGDRWIDVGDISAAVSALPVGARVFLTIGRKEIAAFIERDDLTGIIRMIEPPSIALNANWKLHLAKPPFSIEAERTLMSHETITHLVTKNAGGEATRAKLAAARALSIPVIMVARPGKPDAPCVSKISDAETWLARLPPKASQRRTLA